VDKGAVSRQAHLVIRCSKRKPEVFINVGSRFESVADKSEEVNVGIKFDGTIRQNQLWLAAGDHEAAFSSDPVALVKRMSASKIFLFSFTSFQKEQTTVTFEMRNLREKLGPFADVCGLK
jgi:hypothetical protein